MAKAVKKTTKSTAKKAPKSTTKKVALPAEMSEMIATTPVSTQPTKGMNSKVITLALVVLVIALLTYKVGPWLVPAVVGMQPVTRFELYNRLEKSYGAQALDDMVNEKILDQAIAKSGVKVDQSKLDEQIKSLETQFESTGGLDDALKQRGLSRKDLEKQIRTQLAVEVLLADKITPTDDEVMTQYKTGEATTYKDKKFEDVKGSITEEIKQNKLRDGFLAWFANIKKDTKVKNFGL